MDTEEDRRIQLLQYSINYLERRINLVDNKASILIAIQGGYFWLILWVARMIVGERNPLSHYTATDLQWPALLLGGVVILGLTFALMVSTIWLLILTVRPSKVFRIRMPKEFRPKEFLESGEYDKYVMWFGKKFPKLGKSTCEVYKDYQDYKEKIACLEDQNNIEINYKIAHFYLLKVAKRKYGFYRRAKVGMEYMILSSLIGLLLLAIWRFITW